MREGGSEKVEISADIGIIDLEVKIFFYLGLHIHIRFLYNHSFASNSLISYTFSFFFSKRANIARRVGVGELKVKSEKLNFFSCR